MLEMGLNNMQLEWIQLTKWFKPICCHG